MDNNRNFLFFFSLARYVIGVVVNKGYIPSYLIENKCKKYRKTIDEEKVSGCFDKGKGIKSESPLAQGGLSWLTLLF